MRAIVSQFLNREISRRGFVSRLVGMGYSLAGAEAVLAPLVASENTPAYADNQTPDVIVGTGGALVVEQAKAAGVEYLFTNPGGYEVGLFDAFVDTPGMQMIMGLHEGVVTSMADGYARVSGKPGFINVHAIGGTAQMSGQLYNASRDGSPLVVTAGLNDNEAWSDDFILAPRPGFDEKDVNREFTKISWEARQAASLPLMLRRAFKVATTEPGGPVFLAMAHYALEAKGVSGQILPADRFLYRERMRPNASAVEKAADLLVTAKRPVLVVGDEIWKSGAQAEVVALSEQLGLAAVDNRNAFANFPVRHPHYLGIPGDGVDLDIMKSEFVREGADVIVLVGARDFGGRVVPTSPEVPPNARFVRIGLNTGDIGRNYATDAAVIGDVREALIDLQAAVSQLVSKERLANLSSQRSSEVRAVTSAARARAEAAARQNFGRNPMHPDELGAIVARTIDKDAIVLKENNTGKYEAFSFGYREDEQMMLANTGGCLGWSVGASIGAKLAAPNRQVVCSVGDGSVLFSAVGFWTQARYGIPILTVVSNNHNYQVVRWGQDRYQGRIANNKHYLGMYLGDPDIDFVKLAESQGLKGERVFTGPELESALKRGIAVTRNGKPYLIEAVIARYGPGADSTWHGTFDLAQRRERNV